jgi:hypothetical protein
VALTQLAVGDHDRAQPTRILVAGFDPAIYAFKRPKKDVDYAGQARAWGFMLLAVVISLKPLPGFLQGDGLKAARST